MQNYEENYTLDKLFTNKLKEFELNDYLEYKNQINELNELSDNNADNKKIKKLKSKINKNKKKINDYLLKNSEYLFDYFQMKQNIEINKNPKKTLDNFFCKNVKNNITPHNKINKNIERYLKNNNFELYDDMTNSICKDYDICSNCNSGELIKSTYDGILICNKCYATTKYLINNDKPAYKDPPKEISFYAYRRINHFKEILSQFQAKETTDIPPYIITQIKEQIRKERIDIKELTSKKTKEILKKLKFNKYYEHITFIKDKLGIKPPVMNPQLEETLCNLFIDIQGPYSKHCPGDRVNFLNYYYTLYKLCELLGETKYLPHFPMLKEQKKIEQDEIWKNICNDLDWDFIPTL
jgi:hypothetical protein